MQTKEQIIDGMSGFYGTEEYTRWSPLFRNALLTDGAKWVADNCGAYWLMDMIMSHAKSVDEFPAYAKLVVKDNKATFTLEGWKSKATQEVEFTDFPLDEITLKLGWDGEHYIICLPSED